jgi:ABC-type Fe3+-hydroxamate transport system substrate-binding protein
VKFRLSDALIAALVALLAGACSSPNGEKITLVSPDGRVVVLEQAAQRVVAYSTGAVDVLLWLDRSDALAAIPEGNGPYLVEPPPDIEVLDEESFSAAEFVANARAVNPDLVILPLDVEGLVAEFEAEEIPVVCCDIRDVLTVEQGLAYVETIGIAIGSEQRARERADELKVAFQRTIDAVKQAKLESPKILHHKLPGWAASSGSITWDIYSRLGAQNAIGGTSDEFGTIELTGEWYTELQPDIVIIETSDALDEVLGQIPCAGGSCVPLRVQTIPPSGFGWAGLLVYLDILVQAMYPELIVTPDESARSH